MSHILAGIKNFLQLIEQNWTLIVAILGILIGIYKKIANLVENYKGKSISEQCEIAKKQIAEAMLKWISDAEVDYAEWTKAGSIKRSQVIKRVYEEYPILSKIYNQDEIIAFIDSCIDNSLIELRKIIEDQGGLPTNKSDNQTETSENKQVLEDDGK